MSTPAAQPQTVQISGKLPNELLIQIFEYAAAERPPSIWLNNCGIDEAYRYVDDRSFMTGAGKTGFFEGLLNASTWK